MKSLRYFWYVVRHKAFVFYAGLKTGAPLWRLLLHDWSKFLPSEFRPYRDFFQTPPDKRTPEQHTAFNKAWKLHKERNDHHWEYWGFFINWAPEDQIWLEMPESVVREMVADWMGAGRAITGRWEVKEWYEKNRDIIQLHDATRLRVEALIDAVA